MEQLSTIHEGLFQQMVSNTRYEIILAKFKFGGLETNRQIYTVVHHQAYYLRNWVNLGSHCICTLGDS